ncbi:MAG: TonB-dependent receptor [Flavobacteriaceae bacterium]|nr:TonB-dependent receptor [Flavobacteriaceae bacterium]
MASTNLSRLNFAPKQNKIEDLPLTILMRIKKTVCSQAILLFLLIAGQGQAQDTINPIHLDSFALTAKRNVEPYIVVPHKVFEVFVSVNMDFNKMLPIATSNNELSSSYNVRGGNFDENLVYVNDVEIYRPQLVRSGQQEGLSFVNPDMVQAVTFSAGGFQAKYGDKMSSVLDVTYKQPKKAAASINANLMGIMASAEGASDGMKFSYLVGLRYRANAYLLNSLDKRGNYKPRFGDAQGLFSWNISSKKSISLLVSQAENRYLFLPQDQVTSFGTVQNALQLYIGFEGQELTKYTTSLGALTGTWQPRENTKLKLIASAYSSLESEYFDIRGGYRLYDLDNNAASATFGKAKAMPRGLGIFQNHARNDLELNVLSLQHKGSIYKPKYTIFWGLGFQHENINDRLYEWNLVDSSDYLVPYVAGDTLSMLGFINSKNTLESDRVTGYMQSTRSFSNWTLNAGIRGNYWGLNKQLIFSPRVQVSWEPNKLYNRKLKKGDKRKNDWLLRLAGGYYYQPPFYRELRDLRGVVHTDVKAQQSIHAVAGGDLNFKAWGRPFRFVGEAYYKKYDQLIPYDIDNVKIRYFARNASSGYATGIDLRVNGEFIKGMESWAALSLMKSREHIPELAHWRYYQGMSIMLSPPATGTYDSAWVEWFPRPTDQRFNFNIFFQDYLPKFPSYKMSLNLVVGGPLPSSPPHTPEFRNFYRLPPYRRVDIGFSKTLIDDTHRFKKGIYKNIKNMSISLEVFNLLQFNNAVSYLWVKDLSNRQFAVPNYLTARRLNLHLVMKF